MIHGPKYIKGYGRAWHVPQGLVASLAERLRDRTHWNIGTLLAIGLEQPTAWFHNEIMYDWATIAGQLLTTGLANYRIGSMYMEFKNVVSPGDTVSPPAYTRADGISYYQSLAGSPNTDYLRVPIIAAQLTSTDEIDFPGGNLQGYFALSTGVVGVHGLPFSDADNSLIYGAALVSTPDVNDAAQDLVLSRFYFDPDSQQPKLPTGQVGIQRNLQFG